MDSEIRTVKVGIRTWEFPSETLGQLPDRSHLLGNRDALLEELNDKGYLFIRGLHDREDVLSARLAVLNYVNQCGENKLREGVPWQDGILNQRCGKGCIPIMEGVKEITHHKDVLKVFEGERVKPIAFNIAIYTKILSRIYHVDWTPVNFLKSTKTAYKFFEMLFGAPVTTYNFKWLRAIYREAFTGAHVDNVYMGRGTDQLYTMWTPLGDVTTDMGTLMMCEGSHRLPGFKHFQETYGNCDVEKENLAGTGWFTEDPLEITYKFGGGWKTSDFKAGDALIFTMRTVHMSSTNMSDKLRISCDTRWQPSHLPMDERYIGDRNVTELAFGLRWDGGKQPNQVTMKDMKMKWGFL